MSSAGSEWRRFDAPSIGCADGARQRPPTGHRAFTPRPQPSPGRAFPDCCASISGDSGSLIVRRPGNRATGLLFAGSSTHTIANHIGDVLSALGVTLVV